MARPLNEFSGCSMSALQKRLRHWECELRKIDDNPEEAGGGSPREFPLERIADIEAEIERRKAAMARAIQEI